MYATQFLIFAFALVSQVLAGGLTLLQLCEVAQDSQTYRDQCLSLGGASYLFPARSYTPTGVSSIYDYCAYARQNQIARQTCFELGGLPAPWIGPGENLLPY